MTERTSYNLLDELWIPAIDKKGTTSEYSIFQLVKNAPSLSHIVDPSPVILFGMCRFLTAFIMDVFEISDIDRIKEILDRGTFDAAQLDAYVSRWHDRFDLFHPQWPFYQAAEVAGQDDKEKSVAELFPELPTATNVTHFFHGNQDSHAVSPAACARGLCAIPPFMTAGGSGFSPSINGVPPMYVMISGDTVFETLVLNACGMEITENNGDAPVAWRAEQPVEKRLEIRTFSTLQGMTWQPRYVRLLPGEGGTCTYTGKAYPTLVRRIVFDPGWKAAGKWRDPQVAYRIGKEGPMPLRPQENRQVWRDTGPLLMLSESSFTSADGKFAYSRPRIIEQFAMLKEERIIAKNKELNAEIFAIRTDNAKIFEWVHDKLALPVKLVLESQAGAWLQSSMEIAEKINWAINAAIKVMYPRKGEGNQKAFENLRAMADFKYWTSLETRFSNDLIPTIRGQDVNDINAGEKVRQAWYPILKEIGSKVLDEVIGPIDTNARFLQSQVDARSLFWGLYYKYTAPPGSIRKKSKTSKTKKQT